MNDSSKLPAKCRECAKSKISHPHKKCNFCSELEFKESILCDLNRCIQGEAEFRCHAFQPILKLVNASENRTKDSQNALTKRLKKKSFLELLNSDKIKYERALALQKLGRDPDGVYVQIKYHFAWNVTHRMPAFNPTSHFIDIVHNTLLECSERVGGYVDLLYLAPDHIHIYAESDGELSVEDMVLEIKRFSSDAILVEPSDIKEKFEGDIGIWDEAYFAETVG
jgi:REP element-mobilizing transposase RayT